MSLPGYNLSLYDSLYKISEPVCILDRENIEKYYLESLAERIESIRRDAIRVSKSDKRKGNKIWQIYFKMIGSFTSPYDLVYQNRVIRRKSFDYGYAITVHKSQGSTFTDTFIDMKDINCCSDDETRRQLQYVALSRTQRNAVILQ